ncbi:MAG: 4Fe-4S ferredoxin [Planctomycetes bacterium]|jgi:ferredoxin|nr:4Fe-4S ferredoxin [Planctomycetota bacterium]
MPIRRVWIEEGCISCNLCEDLVSEVFEVPAGETCRPKKGHEKHLTANPEMDERIQEAADSCPVEVIQFEAE